MIKIFIGTYEYPAGGKWYDLYDPTENEEAQATWKKLCDGPSEPLISDVESDFNLISENNIEYYIDMEEFLENCDEDDLPRVCGLLIHDGSYYKNADLLASALDDTTLWTGTFAEVAQNIADDRMSCFTSNKETEALLNFVGIYFDYEKFERDLHIEMNYEAFEYDGQDYILEIY